jgi:predicted phosphodiesterase
LHVAVLNDVHGNLPALEAVLAEVERASPDAVLVGGDVCAGPFPREVLERLLALGPVARFVRGNGDRALLEPGGDDVESERVRWVARRLTQEQRAFLGGLPTTLPLDVDGLGATLFCHGSPRSDEEIVTRATPEKRLRAILAGVDEAVVVFAHTHVQFDRTAAGKRLVNAGSVGLPYEGRPGAYWALLGPDVEFRHTEYDVVSAAEEIRRTGMPQADEVAETLLRPPTPEEATDVFEGMAGA